MFYNNVYFSNLVDKIKFYKGFSFLLLNATINGVRIRIRIVIVQQRARKGQSHYSDSLKNKNKNIVRYNEQNCP